MENGTKINIQEGEIFVPCLIIQRFSEITGNFQNELGYADGAAKQYGFKKIAKKLNYIDLKWL